MEPTLADVTRQMLNDHPGDLTAQEVLEAAPDATLLTAFAALTHRMHAVGAIVDAGTRPRGGDYVVSVATSRASRSLGDLRHQRDLVRAEVLRRMQVGTDRA